MATDVNNGSQIITFDYKNPATGISFNKLLYNIIPSGLYGTMPTFTKINNTSITIDSFYAVLQDSLNNVSVKVRTATDPTAIVSSTNILVVARYVWDSAIENYAEIVGIADGTQTDDDIILGKCNYSGSTLVDFDYTEQMNRNLVSVLGSSPEFITLTTTGQTILARDGGVVDSRGNIIVTAANPELQLIDTGTGSRRLILRSTATENIILSSFASGGSPPLVFQFGAGAESARMTSTLNLLIGTTVDSGPRLVVADLVGSVPTVGAEVVGLFQNNAIPAHYSTLAILGGNIGASRIFLGDTDDIDVNWIGAFHSDNSFRIATATTEAVRITATNHLLVNTTSDLATLHVDGDMRVTGTLGNILIGSSGVLIDMSYVGAENTIRASSSGGGLIFVTNGRPGSLPNANLICNADQSVTVNTTLLVNDGITLGDGTDADGPNMIFRSTGGDFNIDTTVTNGLRLYKSTPTVISLSVNNDETVTIGSTLNVDTIAEKTASAGVTIDDVLNVDTITEKTASAGVSVVDGSFKVIGTDANIILPADGRTLEFTRNAVNYIWATTVGGDFLIGSNGRSLSHANANLRCDADQSVTVNTTLYVDTIAEKTASAGISFVDNILPTASSTDGSWALTTTAMIIPRGIYHIKHNVVNTSDYTVLEMFSGGSWLLISSGFSGSSTSVNSTNGDLVFSDGTNFRVKVATSGTYNMRYRKF